MRRTTAQIFRDKVASQGLSREAIAAQIRMSKPIVTRDEAIGLVDELMAGGPARIPVAMAIIELAVTSRVPGQPLH